MRDAPYIMIFRTAGHAAGRHPKDENCCFAAFDETVAPLDTVGTSGGFWTMVTIPHTLLGTRREVSLVPSFPSRMTTRTTSSQLRLYSPVARTHSVAMRSVFRKRVWGSRVGLQTRIPAVSTAGSSEEVGLH